MTEINYSSLLREIAVDYFEHRLSRVEYLAQRRGVLDRIDHEFNGEDDSTTWPEPDASEDDVTQRNPVGYAVTYDQDKDFDTDDTINEDSSNLDNADHPSNS